MANTFFPSGQQDPEVLDETKSTNSFFIETSSDLIYYSECAKAAQEAIDAAERADDSADRAEEAADRAEAAADFRVEDDIDPSLGGDLKVNGWKIVSLGSENIILEPQDTGNVIINTDAWPIVAPTAGQALINDGSGNMYWGNTTGSIQSRIENGVQDTYVDTAAVSGFLELVTPSGIYFQGPSFDGYDDLNITALLELSLQGIQYPKVDGTSGQVLTTDGSGVLTFQASFSELIQDTSPQLGGDLDANGYVITDVTGPLRLDSGNGIATFGTNDAVKIFDTVADGGQITLTSGADILTLQAYSGQTLVQSTGQLVIKAETGFPVKVDSSIGLNINDAYTITPTNGTIDQVLTNDGAGNAVWQNAQGGSQAFTDLTDTPADYVGQAGNLATVNGTEDGLIFSSVSGGGLVDAVFGRIGSVVAQEGDYTLDLMGDVDLSGLTDDGLLIYDANDSNWVVIPSNTFGAVQSVFGRVGVVEAQEGDYTIDQLGDVTLTSPTDGHILTYQSGGALFVNATPKSLGLLTQVDLAITPTLGDGLLWDNLNSQWLAAPVATGAQGDLADTALQDLTNESIGTLSDVDLSGSLNEVNEFISWDGVDTFEVKYRVDNAGTANTDIWTAIQIQDQINAHIPDGLFPTGGTTNQVVKKVGPLDYDYAWAEEAAANPLWGSIVGTLSDQVDLQNALDGKAALVHTHTESDITNLDKYTQAEVDNLFDTTPPIAHTHLEVDITNLDKYTQQEVDDALALKENAFSKNTAFNKDFGSSAGTVCGGADSRLSDDRDPNPHTHLEVDITNLDKYTQAEVDNKDALKADKVIGASNGNFAGLDVNGNLTDSGVNNGTFAPIVHTHIETDIVDLDRTKWKNTWAQTTYNKNDMVRDGVWTMVANKTTTDPAAPILDDEGFVYDDNIVWSQSTAANISLTGSQYTVQPDKAVQVSAYRVYIPFEASPAIQYVMGIYDVTGGPRVEIDTHIIPDGEDAGWVSRSIAPKLFTAGSVVQVLLFAQRVNAEGEREFFYYTGGGVPVAGGITSGFESTPNFVNISKTDNVANPVNLAGLGIGSRIHIQEGTDISRYQLWETTAAPTDQGTYWGVAAALISFNKEVRDVSLAPTTVEQPSGIPMEYNFVSDYWLDNNASLTNVQGEGLKGTDFGDLAADDDGYGGGDAYGAGYTASPDWDIVALSGGASGNGSGGDGGIPDAPEDGTPYARQDELWINTINSVFQDVSPRLSAPLDIQEYSIMSTNAASPLYFTASGTQSFYFGSNSNADGTKWELNVVGTAALKVEYETNKTIVSTANGWFRAPDAPVIGDDLTNKTFTDATYAALVHTHAATDVVSGVFADARIQESNVTQHEAALELTMSQITDSTWISDISGSPIEELSNVGATLPTTGQYLRFNGADYLPSTIQEDMVEMGGYSDKWTSLAAIDASQFNFHKSTITAPIAISFTSVPNGAYTCFLEMVSDGFNAPTYPVNVTWVEGYVPPLIPDTEIYQVVLTSVDNGTNWVGSHNVTDASLSWGNITGVLSAQTDLQDALDAKQNLLLNVAVYTANHIADITDTGRFIEMDSATALSITIPPYADVAFGVGTEIHLTQAGIGTLSVVAGLGVTITSTDSLDLRAQYSTATLVNVAENEWTLFGDLAPNVQVVSVSANILAGHEGEAVIVNGTADGLELTPLPVAPIYGTEYQFEQDLTESTTTATTPQNKLQLVTPSLPAGTYELEINYAWALGSASQSWMGRLTENAVVLQEVSIEPKDITNYTNSFGKVVVVLAAGVYTYEIDYWSESGATASIKNVLMTIKRVA